MWDENKFRYLNGVTVVDAPLSSECRWQKPIKAQNSVHSFVLHYARVHKWHFEDCSFPAYFISRSAISCEAEVQDGSLCPPRNKNKTLRAESVCQISDETLDIAGDHWAILRNAMITMILATPKVSVD